MGASHWCRKFPVPHGPAASRSTTEKKETFRKVWRAPIRPICGGRVPDAHLRRGFPCHSTPSRTSDSSPEFTGSYLYSVHQNGYLQPAHLTSQRSKQLGELKSELCLERQLKYQPGRNSSERSSTSPTPILPNQLDQRILTPINKDSETNMPAKLFQEHFPTAKTILKMLGLVSTLNKSPEPPSLPLVT